METYDRLVEKWAPVLNEETAGTISDNGQIIVADLETGTYTATEDDPTPAFDVTDTPCHDDDLRGDVGTGTATFNLEAGETVRCTFTNRERGTIVIITGDGD